MQVSRLGREARRRPELDLLLGPLEAATRRANTTRADTPENAGEPRLELIELADPVALPTLREDE